MSTLIWAIVVLGTLAIIFGLILAVAAKVFEVEVDPRLPEIQACLAGANCGGCGYPGCGGCAEAILAGKAPVTACAPAGPEGAAKIAAIMGMAAPSGDKMVAHVMCNGEDQAEDDGESAQYDDRPNQSSHILLPPYQTFRPLKPMNARAIRPAVTSAMGKPSKALGFSLETSSCSRIAANRKMASRKPRPPVIP